MEVYKRLWPYVRRYFKWTTLAILCTLVVSGMTGLTAWLIKPVLDDIFIKKNSGLLSLLPLAVVAIYVVKNVFTYLQSYLMQYASNNVVRDIWNDLYGHMVYLPMTEYNKTATGKLISNMISDVGMLSRLVASVVKDFLQNTFTIIGLVVVLFIRDWRLALVSMFVLPLIGVFISKYGKRMRRITHKTQESVAGILNTLQESFTGIRIVKAFTMEDEERGKFSAKSKEYTRLAIKSARVSSLVSPTMDTIGGIAVALIIFYGGNMVVKDTMSAGDFFSFTAALVMLYGPVKSLGNLHNTVQQALAAADRVFDVFDTDTEMPFMDRGVKGPEGMKEGIVYKDVCFRYDGHGDEVLRGINITINKGEVVALVGSSGGGKSTIVNLLPRFYEVESGAILIDGVDIREYSLRTLRRQVSVVTQDTILFNDTIKNNITYGKKEFTEEQVVAAAKAAHADGFIEKMPARYDTHVGEKGVRLSGGEKQRISIARAILKDSPILILDEATSSLDTESERIVQKALENLMKDRTTLVIAHRLSTIINADKIVVINDGAVADIGRHSELLGKSPLYRRLYEMQFSRLEGEHAEAL